MTPEEIVNNAPNPTPPHAPGRTPRSPCGTLDNSIQAGRQAKSQGHECQPAMNTPDPENPESAARLDEQHVRETLARHPELELAILFGSRAAGSARRDSDIDLAVSVGRPLSANERMALLAEVAVATGQSVDLIDLTRTGEPLLGQILKGGKRLVGDADAYARLLTRHLLDQADFLPYRQRILAERRKAWIEP